MKRFKQYLAEKVTRQDFTKILRDSNVIIGGEFEIISHTLRDGDGRINNGGDSDDYDAAHDAWNSWRREYRDFVQKLDDYREERDEAQNKIYSALQRLAEEILECGDVDDLNTQDEEIDVKPSEDYFEFMKSVVGLDEDEIIKSSDVESYTFEPDNDHLYKISITLHFQKYENPRRYAESINQSDFLISQAEQKRLYDHAVKQYDTYEEKRSSIEEIHNDHEEGLSDYDADYNHEPHHPGEPNDVYFSYMEDVLGYDRDTLELETDDDYHGGVSEYMEPMPLDSDNGDEESPEGFRAEISASPFGNEDIYFSGLYHGTVTQKQGDRYWRVESDSSLSDGGVEIISPPLPIDEFLPMCKKVFEWIEEIGETDSSCGFHINMSLANVPDLLNTLNPVKLIMLLDEEYIYRDEAFSARKLGIYCRSSKDQINNYGPKDIEDIFDQKGLTQKVVRTKMKGVNLSHSNRVEFRYMGGAGYHRKFETIKAVIGHYAISLSAACDPKFMQKEYYQRLSGVQRNLDAAIARNKIDTIETWISTWTTAIQKGETGVVIGVEPQLFDLAIKVAERLRIKYEQEYRSYTTGINPKHLPTVERLVNGLISNTGGSADLVNDEFDKLFEPLSRSRRKPTN